MKQVNSVLIIYYAGAFKGKIEEFMPIIKKRLYLRYSIVDAIAGYKENDSEKIAFENANKYDIIISCGGDGTLHQVINGVAKSGANPIVGVLPYGTCNDVAHTLSIPKDLDKALDCILRLNTTSYDLLFDGTEYTTYSLAAGYVTPVSFVTKKGLKKVFGRFAYFLTALKYLFTAKSMPVTITYDGKVFDGKAPFVLLSNSKYVGGFKFHKEEDLNDGKVSLIVLKGNPFINAFRLARLFLFGLKSVKKSKSVIIDNVSKLEIRNHSNAVYAMDGEKCNFLKKELIVNKKITLITI